MPYSDPTGPPDGFEGSVLGTQNPNQKPKTALGFEGVILSAGATGFKRPAVAFEGLIIAFKSTDRFIKITDFRGNPVTGVTVTVENTGGDFSAVTDALGTAAVQVDTTGTKTIRLAQNKTFSSFSYTYASESLTKTVVFMPRLLE